MLSQPDERSGALLSLCERQGFARVETAILQPAALFLELSGEDIRRRLYQTQDAAGAEHCLRPEHTIPVCRDHLASGSASGAYCYLGPVFRQRAGETGEFVQAGFETIGIGDIAEQDARTLALALEAVAIWGPQDLVVRTGDMDLIEALLRALEVPRPLQRRVIRTLSVGTSVKDVLRPQPVDDANYAGLLAAIEGQDPRAARAFVEDVISIAGIAAVGGRSPAEIAERFLARANRGHEATDRARAVLQDYFAIEASLADAADLAERLAAAEGLAIGDALAAFRNRVELLARRGIPVDDVRFAASFARNFDYYTGFIFEVRRRSAPPGRFVAAGGRYDRLLQRLGSPTPVPAIGCSFWIDRLAGAA